MPRDVVPMAMRSGRFSLTFSAMRWNGKITWARLETANWPRTSMPASSSVRISSSSAFGSMTTPLPMTARLPGCRMPLGMSLSTNRRPPAWTVCPALCPPW